MALSKKSFEDYKLFIEMEMDEREMNQLADSIVLSWLKRELRKFPEEKKKSNPVVK